MSAASSSSSSAPPAPPAEGEKEKEKEKFFHPETGEQMSKNAYKALISGKVKKEKKEKPPPTAPKAPKTEKEKKPKKEKVAEEIFTDATPAGEKKLNNVFPPTYQPKYVEAAWQSWWEKSGYYGPNMDEARARAKDGENMKFVMVIPPPNVTGSLHLGHALTTAVEDTITRYNRMLGKVTCWVPGTDHAGIATQSVVEKRIKKEENVSRHDLGREAFVGRVWEWKEMYGNKITSQIKSLGASVDWKREAFTMDSNLSRAVNEAFCRFYEDGLIYRDTRLINWSCALQSAISEIEVDYIDIESRTFLPVPNHKLQDKYEFGMITSFAYKVVGSEEELVVATTRLETMLGDTGVAVHPEDPRYTHLHGKFLQHPFVDRQIPIITDPILVDMNFGTGAVKITPAHDPNDYNCGKRNNLEFIVMLSEDGTINAQGGMFTGMQRYDARVAMEKELDRLGLYRGKEVNKMRLGLCSRSHDIIEPMLTPQWYVNCNSMAEKSIKAVREGELKIMPDIHEATWYRWLENIRDWCISRQLWWGHRIPAYFARVRPSADQPGAALDKNDPANKGNWVVARTPEQAAAQAAEKLGVSDVSLIELEQDPDVLDTWFSSGLFPFSVFGWPDNTEDLQLFYPTSLLETGHDILFFWVARMVMMGIHLTGQLPFKKVYLHAMVRDKVGRKMSKSLGNVIDPLEVISGCSLANLLEKIDNGNLAAKEMERAKLAQKNDFPDGLPECGTDALRFGLLAYTVQGRDVNLDIKRIVGYRQFCNKLWNAVRFALTYVDNFQPTPTMHMEIATHPGARNRDLAILSKLNTAIAACNANMEEYNFGAVTTALHSFFLYDLCDVYLELIKPVIKGGADSEDSNNNSAANSNNNSRSNSEAPAVINTDQQWAAQATLYTCLEQFLRLAHPLMPFVTEELWQRLPNLHSSGVATTASIMIARYPQVVAHWSNPAAEADLEIVTHTIHAARSLRTDYKVANHVKANFYYRSDSADVCRALDAQADDFCTLSKGRFLVHLPAETAAPKSSSIKVVNETLSLLVDLTGLIDFDQELARLGKEKERLQPMIDSYVRKINAPGYETKVPANVQAVNAEKLAAYESEMQTTIAAIESFEKMKL